jgi:hypothetical protein
MGSGISKILAAKSNSFVAILALMLVLVAVLFHDSFIPGYILASNDGPLGALKSACRQMPDKFSGSWQDLSTIGSNEGAASPCVTYGLQYLLGPVLFSKFYPPVALLLLGIGAWCFFSQLRLAPLACLLGGLAAMLNSSFFSVACWGIAGHTLTVAMSFFALAALADTKGGLSWVKLPLAGFAVGLGVADGADVGAIFSVFVAIFAVYQGLVVEDSAVKGLSKGVARVAIVAIVSALVAAQAVSVLVSTNIQGVAGTKQDTRSKEDRWEFATTWSLPKRELLCLVIPGLFGYRMDSSQHGLEGGDYWGKVGCPESVDRIIASGGKVGKESLRFTGGGNYAGVLVVLLAAWAAVQALRKQDSIFSPQQRKLLWFWMGLVVVGLLLAVGRYAPFYRLVYALPYFSTIRNPAKFIYVVNWAIVILFAHGMHGLCRGYFESPATQPRQPANPPKSWWAAMSPFDRKWTILSGALMVLSVTGWLVYSSSRETLVNYLQEMGPPDLPPPHPPVAQSVASFSIQEVGLFVIVLAICVSLITFILSGRLRGVRGRWPGIALGVLLFVDLARANQPWIIYWNWKEKYASDPVLDFLRTKPYEQRVVLFPLDGILNFQQLPREMFPIAQSYLELRNLYHVEWKQHQFQYYDIECLDVIQMPRMPEDLVHFLVSVQPSAIRYWELSSTRYFLGQPALMALLNQRLDVGKGRFRVLKPFDIAQKPGMSGPEDKLAVPGTNGQYAVIEFTGALPKAMLVANWEVCAEDAGAVLGLQTDLFDPANFRLIQPPPTNDPALFKSLVLELLQSVGTNDFLTLKKLPSPLFDPRKTVLLDQPVHLPSAAGATNGDAGTVDYTSYSSKKIKLHAKAASPCVLLLNDKYDPSWKVFVDGKQDKVLRCNYIMRGVALPAGDHQVEFRFEPPIQGLYVSLVSSGLCLALLGLVVFVKAPAGPQSDAPLPSPAKSEARLAEAIPSRKKS